MEITRVDRRIIRVLRVGGINQISTYQIAKKASISWSTAISHCYKLMVSGIIDGKEIKTKFGNGRTMVWWKK